MIFAIVLVSIYALVCLMMFYSFIKKQRRFSRAKKIITIMSEKAFKVNPEFFFKWKVAEFLYDATYDKHTVDKYIDTYMEKFYTPERFHTW